MLTTAQSAAREKALQANPKDLVEKTNGKLHKISNATGGRYAGACPFCKDGKDRFFVQISPAGWSCRHCSDKFQDVISLYTALNPGATFQDALIELGDYYPESDTERGTMASYMRYNKPVTPTQPLTITKAQRGIAPLAAWQRAASGLIDYAERELWGEHGAAPLDYLRGRGLSDETIKAARLGYNPKELYRPAEKWGETGKDIWIPKGIVIGWENGGEVWRVNVRRDDWHEGDSYPKYTSPRGWAGSNPLYNAHSIKPYEIAVLSEGEFDALSIHQATGGSVASLATGSTGAARLDTWLMALASCDLVLITFDNDESGAGERGAAWWLERLPNAFRWLPPVGCKDSSDLLKAQGDDAVLEWLEDGINAAADNGVNMFTGDKIRAFLA